MSFSHPGICSRVNSVPFTFITNANRDDLKKVMELQVHVACCRAAKCTDQSGLRLLGRGTGLAQAAGGWNVSDCAVGSHK